MSTSALCYKKEFKMFKLLQYLAMCVWNCVTLVGINCAPVLWAHQIGVDIKGIWAATSTITVGVIVGCNIVTGVQGGHHGVLVTFIGVILRAEVVVDKVGITVVIPTCQENFENSKTCLTKCSVKKNFNGWKINDLVQVLSVGWHCVLATEQSRQQHCNDSQHC